MFVVNSLEVQTLHAHDLAIKQFGCIVHSLSENLISNQLIHPFDNPAQGLHRGYHFNDDAFFQKRVILLNLQE